MLPKKWSRASLILPVAISSFLKGNEMPEPESMNTMFHDSFVKNADGSYSLKTVGAGASGESTVQTVLPTASRANSVVAYGKSTAPAAGAAIATTASLAVGTWDIEVSTFIGGTTAAVEIDNMQLKLGATVISTILNPVPGTTGAVNSSQYRVRLQVGVAAAVSVNAIAAATAASVYAASIVATRVM